MLALAILLVYSELPDAQARREWTTPPTLSPLPPSPSPTASPTSFPRKPAPIPPGNVPAASSDLLQEPIILAMGEGGYTHLFRYQPSGTPFTRLTDGPWSDIDPAFSPDGNRLAFASNRSGNWELYMMDFSSGEVTRLTDTPAYEGSPSWSPDGMWLVYESYVGDENSGNLELFIRSLDGKTDPIRLTYDPGADFSPVWSPLGRQIAFVSTRSGDCEIWLASLDQANDRFMNVSRDDSAVDLNPAWSPDGSKLAWSTTPLNGIQSLRIWNLATPELRPRQLSGADRIAWSPSGGQMIASIRSPNRSYLTGYKIDDGSLALPILPVSGTIEGIAWGKGKFPERLPTAMEAASQISPTPLWNHALLPGTPLPGGRMQVTALQNVQPAGSQLQDQVDEAFNALRARVSQAAGWDFLSSLEASFVPLTTPLSPGMREDWLYTGRAFRFNPAPVGAGWLVVVREDDGPQTYWRVFLRARFQDGSQGMPLKALPWLMEARHSGDPLAYERGGALAAAPPPGYWVDFSELALAYGWERFSALSSWLTSYSAARFNEFALTEGLDWFSAMLELYPKAALDTPTPVPSPTDTPTVTATFTETPTLTRTPYVSPTPSNTPTRRPTRTPLPGNQPRFTPTPTP